VEILYCDVGEHWPTGKEVNLESVIVWAFRNAKIQNSVEMQCLRNHERSERQGA
jgi:hypothetical protein